VGRRSLILALTVIATLVAGIQSAQAHAAEPQKLFALDAEVGSLTPVAGKAETYRLVLEDVRGRAIFFTDRPARDVGTVVVQKMLRELFAGDSPDPNAAINATAAGRGQLLMGVELLGWHFDTHRDKLILRVRHLPHGGRTIGDVSEDAVLPRSFREVSVFIDDCCSVMSSATALNPGQAALTLVINNGFPISIPGTSPETWLPGSASIEFGRSPGPQPGVLGPGANSLTIFPEGAPEPVNFTVDLPTSYPYQSVQLYIFRSPFSVTWTVLSNGTLVASGSTTT
jgi:hypothetical protein